MSSNPFSLLTQQHVQEGLSRSYVKAVAASARLIVQDPGEYDYGIDGTFRKVEEHFGRLSPGPFSLDFQLKATIDYERKADSISYDLEVGSYNKLIARQATNPVLLIVLCLHVNHSEWLNVSDEHLVLKESSYWYLAAGDASTNKKTHRIHIPSKNLVTADALIDLMTRLESGVLRNAS